MAVETLNVPQGTLLPVLKFIMRLQLYVEQLCHVRHNYDRAKYIMYL